MPAKRCHITRSQAAAYISESAAEFLSFQKAAEFFFRMAESAAEFSYADNPPRKSVIRILQLFFLRLLTSHAPGCGTLSVSSLQLVTQCVLFDSCVL